MRPGADPPDVHVDEVRVRVVTDTAGAERLGRVAYGSTPATCPVRALRAWLDQFWDQALVAFQKEAEKPFDGGKTK